MIHVRYNSGRIPALVVAASPFDFGGWEKYRRLIFLAGAAHPHRLSSRCDMWVTCERRPTIRPPTLISPPTSHRPPPSIMTTLEPWAVGGSPTNVEYHPATATMLNADIEVAPVKAVFESIIAILTLVKVRFLLFPLLHPLIGDTTRAR